MLLLTTALAGTALAATPAEVSTRLEEFEPHVPARIGRAPAIPPAAWSQAASSGEPVTGVDRSGDGPGTGWGVAVFEVGIAELWSGLNDERRHRDLLGMTHIEIVRGTPCADRRHVLMVLPLPIVSDRWWINENHYNPALVQATNGRVRELAWKGVNDPAAQPLSPTARSLVEGAVAVTDNRGGWLLIALDDDTTLVEYHAVSDPGGHLPEGAATTFASGTIASTMEKIASYAASSTPSCQAPP